MKLENYLNDGANWQAVGVMAYLRSCCLKDRIEAVLEKYADKFICVDVCIGRYENCREQGYILSVKSWGEVFEQINYVFYEHRNSDELCVYRFSLNTINTPTLAEVPMKDKWDTTKDFKCGEIVECGNWIVEDACSQFQNICEEKFKNAEHIG